MVFGVDNLEHQPTLRFAQHLAQCLVAFLDFPFLRREFRWGIKAVI